MQRQNFGYVRFWLIVSSVFGMALMTLLVGVYFYYSNKVWRGNASSNLFINSYAKLSGPDLALLIFLIWTVVKTFVFNFGLIKYARSADSYFVANKWTLAVLSLSLGGFWAPLLLTRLPNADTNATQNARITIVRYFGTSFYIAAISTILIMLIVQTQIPVANRVWIGNGKAVFYGVIGAMAGFALINMAATAPFYGTKVEKMFAARSEGYRKYWNIAIIFTVIATVQLVFVMIAAFLRLLAVMSEMAQQRSPLGIVFGILNIGIQIAYTVFICTLIVHTISGLWRSDQQGMVMYRTNQRFAEAQTRRQQQRR